MSTGKSRKLVIAGAGRVAEVAYEYFTHDSPYEVVGFAVESAYRKVDSLFDLPVVPFESVATTYEPSEHSMYVAVVYTGLNRVRTRLAAAAKASGYRLATYVSSRAHLWPGVVVGEHCFILENNCLEPFVRVGSNVILWSGNSICHHSQISDNCFVAAGTVISGNVRIGESSFIGANATVANDVRIGRDVWIGPSVTVTRDIAAGSVYHAPHSELRGDSSYRLFDIER